MSKCFNITLDLPFDLKKEVFIIKEDKERFLHLNMPMSCSISSHESLLIQEPEELQKTKRGSQSKKLPPLLDHLQVKKNLLVPPHSLEMRVR